MHSNTIRGNLYVHRVSKKKKTPDNWWKFMQKRHKPMMHGKEILLSSTSPSTAPVSLPHPSLLPHHRPAPSPFSARGAERLKKKNTPSLLSWAYISFKKMAASQGGAAAAAVLQGHHYPAGPHWSANGAPPQPQAPHTARSLDRALDDAASSGVLNISGRKLRDYPGLSYDLTDTTHAGGSGTRSNSPEPIKPCMCDFSGSPHVSMLACVAQ